MVTYEDLINSIENNFFPEIQIAIDHRAVKPAFIAIMAAIDMVMKTCFDEMDKRGFEKFSRDFLVERNKLYSTPKWINGFWKLRVGLTHNWVIGEIFCLLPDLKPDEKQSGILNPRTDSHLIEVGNCKIISINQFFDDVKISIYNELAIKIYKSVELQDAANRRLQKLLKN